MEQNQSSFNWIKTLAVPLAVGIMEMQPVALVVVFVLFSLSGQSEAPLLVELVAIVCTWSLYWWALFTTRMIGMRKGERRANLLYASALPAVFVLIVAFYPAFFDTPVLIYCVVLQSLYLWGRSKKRVAKDLRGESVLGAFLAGFVMLLLFLFVATTVQRPAYQALQPMLAFAFPLFCLSGLTALSLSRLDVLFTLHRSRFSGNMRTNPIHRWIGTLLILAGAIAVVSIVLSATVFPALATLFAPLKSLLLQFVAWVFSWHGNDAPYHFCYPDCSPVQIPSSGFPPYHNPLSDLLVQILRGIGLCLLFLMVTGMVILIVRFFLRGRKSTGNADEEREQLPVRLTIEARRPGRKDFSLEGFDVASARARYREFLNAMARRGKGQYKRRLDETPAEYQQRLLAPERQRSQRPTQPGLPGRTGVPDEAAILETLTRAYTLERYGGQPAPASQRAYLRQWLSLLIKRLAGK